MTPTEIQNVIAAKSAELNDHVKDVELLARLQAAPDNKARLQRELAELTARLNDAYAAEATAKREAFRNSIRNVAIVDPPGAELSTVYTITYEKPCYDMAVRETVWQRIKVEGFGNLDANVMRHVLTFSPEKLPSYIRALDPADPFKAMERYWRSRSRGYLVS